MKPFLSIVIPTRDRPQFLRHALWSALNQTDGDLEVIVCDNPVNLPAKTVFDQFSDSRCRYLPAPEPLNMADNWNRGIEAATGKYVTILEDKFALRLNCVACLKEIEMEIPAEIYHWSADNYFPEDETRGCERGTFSLSFRNSIPPVSYDPKLVVEKRLSHEFARGTEGRMYHAGKIVFGVYRDTLIEKITSRVGRPVPPIAPDYTTMTAALLLTDGIVDMGRSLCVQLVSDSSNGSNVQRKVAFARDFYSSFGEVDEVLAGMPIPGLPTPCHNVCALAYTDMCEALPEKAGNWSLNYSALYFRCEKELELVEWTSPEEKSEQLAILEKSRATFPWRHRMIVSLRRKERGASGAIKPLARLLRKTIERWLVHPATLNADHPLWKRWINPRDDVKLSGNFGVNAILFFLEIRDRMKKRPGSGSSKAGRDRLMKKLGQDIEQLKNRDPEVFELLEQLVAIEEERVSAAETALTEKNAKLENFRGMIQRRNERIEKLEKKLKLRKK